MDSSSDPNLTKKSKGRCVSSRYKQSAEKYISDGTSSGASKFNLTRNQRQFSSTLLDKTKANQTTTKKTHSTPDFADVAPPNFDESAIPNASCTIGAFSKTDRLKQKSLNSAEQKKLKIKSSAQKNALNIPSSRGAGKKNKCILNKGKEDIETELDISYAQYQLNLLLENKARRSLHNKSKKALEKISEIFCYIQVLLGKHENIKKCLNVVSFLLELQEHLHKQEKMLVPALRSIDVIEKQYTEIATAIDCVRHKLLIENVMRTEGSEEEIIHLLNDIDNFLNLILTSVGNVDVIVNSSDSASALVKKGKLTSEEIKRGLELITEARSLMLSETTLKFASFNTDVFST